MDELFGWLDASSETPIAFVVPPSEPKPTPKIDQKSEEPPARPVRRCLTVNSPAYQRASLARKFRAAAMQGTIPGALSIQRLLQAELLSKNLDLWRAVDLLMQIEQHVRADSVRTPEDPESGSEREGRSPNPDKSDSPTCGRA